MLLSPFRFWVCLTTRRFPQSCTKISLWSLIGFCFSAFWSFKLFKEKENWIEKWHKMTCKICKAKNDQRTASFCHSLVVPSEPEIVGISLRMLCHTVSRCASLHGFQNVFQRIDVLTPFFSKKETFWDRFHVQEISTKHFCCKTFPVRKLQFKKIQFPGSRFMTCFEGADSWSLRALDCGTQVARVLSWQGRSRRMGAFRKPENYQEIMEFFEKVTGSYIKFIQKRKSRWRKWRSSFCDWTQTENSANRLRPDVVGA